MSDSQESMEVTLQTEVESGASGFSVAGGGAEGIFVKQVLKESPASKLFSLREGDQLLSATIFFDNIKYEDALKILQYSEPYKVQFNLKRKLVGKDEPETIHSETQSKKEKLSQGRDTLEISEKTISEEDKTNLIVKQRVGRQKRTKKDRLSWPKFQSIKGKKILGHRRSRSTSDAYEHGIPDVSPTSTDTESQFQPEETHGKIKKQSQKKLKFPTIGFKMHKSKQEPYEVNPFKEYENDTTMELPDVMTREYTTSFDIDRKTREKQEPKREVSDTIFQLPQHTRKYPDVELTIPMSKEKKAKSNVEFTKQEPTVTTSQMKTAVIQTKDISDSQMKVSQNIPKIRKKKQKDTREKLQTETQYRKDEKGKETTISSKHTLPHIEGPKFEMDINMPKVDISLPKADHKATKSELKMGEITADINISVCDIKSPTGQAVLGLQTPDLETKTPSGKIPPEGSEGRLEDDDGKFKMLKFQMPKFGISLPKGKGVPEGHLSMEGDLPKTGMKGEVTLPTTEFEADIKLPKVEVEAPSLDVEATEKGKIKMPGMKVPSVKVPKLKTPEVGISLPKVEADVSLPKGKAEVPEAEMAVKVPEAEGTIEGGGMKIHMPKFKMPSMGFSKPDIRGPKLDMDVSMPKVDISLPEAELHVAKPEMKAGKLEGDISISAPDIKIPTGEATLELKVPDVDIEAPSGKVAVEGPDLKLESGDSKFKMPKFQMPKFGISLPKGKGVPEGEVTIPSMEADLPKTGLKAEVTLPSAEPKADIKLPEVEIETPSLDVEVGEKGKLKMPGVKVPSVKVPKLKTPEVGISLPKVEADVSLPKGKAEVPEGEMTVKVPEAEGTIEGAGMKIHMPKFKMPSMGFSKRDIKGPKVDVDVSMPKVDISFPEAKIHVAKPEMNTGELAGDISISAPDIKIPTDQATLELKAPDVEIAAPSGKVAVEGPDVKLETGDSKFKMPKFQMPKFGITLPKGKGVPHGEVTIPSVEADRPKTGLQGEITLPSMEDQADLKVPAVEVEAPSLDMEIWEEGKLKMPGVKVPSVKVPKLKTPEVGISLPKVEADVSLPKGKAEVPQGEVAVKVPEAEGTIEGRGMKIHMPKFKMPSVGLSKPDIKGPKVDIDVSMPKIDISIPEAEIHVAKPELKAGELKGDISISAPDVKIPTGQATLELKAPDVDIAAPSGKVAVEGPDVKLESGDSKFKMPKFQMPKFGISLPKGKGVPEGEVTIPSVHADLPKTGLKSEITLPSAELEADIKLPEVEVEVPSLDVEVGEEGKLKMPGVKMPSVKVPKLKTPEVGISVPKVEADVSLPKGKAKVPEGEVAEKVPEAEGTIEGGGMKIHMPKFKMPSMGFSKPDIKGPKVDVDITMPKVDISLPEAELHVAKPEMKAGEPKGDISISAPDIKIPTGQATLELKAPDVDIAAPSGKVAVEGPDVKLESGDSKFKIPKFQMPKFGISLPKGKGVPEGEVTIPSVQADLPKTGLKSEITLPSAELEADIKLPEVEVEVPSLDVEVGEKGKLKMPGVKMPSVKVPKLKTPEVGISLPKVEADVSLPKGKAKVPEGEVAEKVPEAEGTIEGSGMKIHMPKLKMPTMGFSKPDIKGPKVDVDVSMPKVDISLPEAELHVAKPEMKAGELKGDISISAPDVKIPTGQATLELKAPDVDIVAPSGKVAVEVPDVKLGSGDSKFKMPKFKMPKLGISLPKGKAVPEGEVTIPSMEGDLPKTELKTEVSLPSAEIEGDIKLPEVEVEAPSLDMEIVEKGKIKMPGVKTPSVKVPKLKTPEVGISLPKVEADIFLPKEEAEVPEGKVAVKVPEAEGTIEGRGMKIHMPKFKMPSMGFSKPDIKGPKVDMDVSMPKVDISLPEAELHVAKPEMKAGELKADISISAPDVKIPTGQATLELKAPDVDIEAPSGKVAVELPDVKPERGDSKFKMPKFQMPKFGITMPKGKGVPEGEVTIPSVQADLPKTGLKSEITLPSAELEADIKLPEVEVEVPSLDVEVGEKGKIKMPGVKMPSVKAPKLKTPEVDISVPKVEADISLPKGDAAVPEGKVAVKLPDTEGRGMKIHMPKFKMPSMGFSKPDIKGPKLDVDVSMAKVDISLPEAELHIAKPKIKAGELKGDISISAPDVKIPTGQATLELEIPDLDLESSSGKVAVEGPDVKVESGDIKFKMPKFQMPKFGISLPKGKGVPEGEVIIPSVEADLPKTGVKSEITLPSAELEADIKLPEVEVEVPSLDLEVGEKGRLKMPGVKMPSVKVPKLKTPEVGISLAKVETDVSLPKGKAEVPEGEVAVKVPEAEGTIEGGGMKIHMPKFKMPSMGFSKPDTKGPKVDVDVSMPKVDISIPEAELHVAKPEIKSGELEGNIRISAPDIKIPTGQATMELKAPDVQIEAPSGKVAVEGPDVKLESGDSKFKMPKFKMPRLGISLPKGKAVPEEEVTIPSMEGDLPKTELKAEVSLPSAELEGDIKLPELEVEALSLDMDITDKGKLKMPGVKMPSVKVAKLKTPEVGISLPKVEADVCLPTGKAKVPEGEVAVNLPEAEGTIEGGGIKIHMPKFKMPSMGFSKPDIKGPKVDVDVSMPKVDLSLPEAELHVAKPEMKAGEPVDEISISAPDVKIPMGQATLELKAPDVDIKAPSGKVTVQGPDVKLESGDSKFKMPKFKMPKLGISLPKGKAVPEGEVTIPFLEADLPKTVMKVEVALPSTGPEADIKLPEVEVQGPSLDVEVGEKGKLKMPGVKMPSLKAPKLKAPEVGISLPKVEADLSLPKGKAEVPEVEAAVKMPESEGTIEGGGMKIHMPKFKMPSMGFSKPEIKGPKVDMDLSVPKVDLSLPEAKIHVAKPDMKAGEVMDDISISATEIGDTLELKTPDLHLECSSSKVTVQGPDVKLESGDSKFQMPKLGISLPKGKGVPEGEVTIPSVEADFPKTGLKAEVTLPSAKLEADIKLPELEAEPPCLDMEIGEKGKIKMPGMKLPSMKAPKLTSPEVGITLPKSEADVSLSKAKAEMHDSEAAIKVAGAEDSHEKGRMKIHMPRFKMPSMGFSKQDIKGPKIDVDVSMPDVHVSLPKAELSATEPRLKTDELEGDLRIAAPDVKIPRVPVTVELKAPNIGVQACSGKIPDTDIGLPKDVDVPQLKTTTDITDIAVEAPTLEMESDVPGEKKKVLEEKMKMSQIFRVDVKTAAVGIPSVDISVAQSEVSTQDSHAAAKEPETKGEVKSESLDGEEKGHFKMPKFKLPSLSWSPKKEASLKTNIKEPLEESKLTIVSDDTGTEPKVTLSQDQGVHIDQNVEIATKKGQVKRPHITMPKISLSKTKLPRAEVDIVVEGDGASVQIPDIESSFTTRKVEETEISVKMLKDEIKEEIKTFQTDTDINLSKTDIKVPMTKSSFEQKSLETEFKGDVCMDNASMKSDGTEGKFSMPKLKMPNFGISHQESDVSESGIILPKTESDVSQFQMTTESDKLGGKALPLEVKNDEANPEEIQTEESQSWFKMPKFKMPSFGRTSSKTKKSDAETEDSTGKALVTELQVEVKSPEVVTTSPHMELDIGKDILEQEVMLPQEDIQSNTDLLVGEGSFLQSSDKAGRKLSDLETKTYADVVKHGAEGQSLQIHKTGFIGPTSEIAIPKMDIDINIPKSEMTLQQHQVTLDPMGVAEVPPTEITMGRKIDPTISDTEPLQSLDTQPEEMGSEKKSPKKDTQGKESIFKMPTFSVPLFGWSTTKSSAIVPGIVSDLEEPAVALSKISITDEDFEIIDYPTEGFEKDLPTEDEVKAEEKEKSSKSKASKFKIPKFANLRSKSQGAEIQVDPPKMQTEVSLVKPEGEIPGIQVQDKKPGDAEVSFLIPKFKMPKFTHIISEGETLTSEETMDIKHTTTDDISQLQFRTMLPEGKGDTGYDIQKSKVRITTLSEPAIQRPLVGSKLPSTDSSFADTTVYIQVPKKFSAEFLTEKIDTKDGNIQKSIAKITTLREPDIQKAPLEIKLQPEDPFSPSAPVQVQGSYIESKEIKMEDKSTFGYGDAAEIQESFSSQIVKESEILPSEVKTAAFGFSLLKVKIQESHVSLDTPVKLSSTECMDETFEGKDHQLSGSGETAQMSGLGKVKPSGKDKDITCEFTEEASSATTLTKLKAFTAEVQSSSEFAESHSEPIEISKSAVEIAEETKFTSSTEEPTDEKEKLDSKRSSGRFKLWLPSIGFSSTAEGTMSDSKPEAQQEIQSDDSSVLDSDTAKQTEKTGWFRFPKLGFSSPTKKSKEADKEKETDPKEGKDEESPTEKSETFFDAQETLSLKEKEENETSGDIPSEPIVSSSARTELILLEKGKAEPQCIPEGSSK
ncbi:protein AHNAK2 isoform X2 [Python bivittatus]|uniref:Protein AHNAK2 isoform X2 n=1 Tax=Python bivittatus TaxID=176946 RepID=A0A9F5ILV4_PYTBI|nr:protein AHNAK2 isoform X2 [Python bivittatus]